MTTYVLTAYTKVRKEVIETHKIEKLVKASGDRDAIESVGKMAPVDVWKGARLVILIWMLEILLCDDFHFVLGPTGENITSILSHSPSSITSLTTSQPNSSSHHNNPYLPSSLPLIHSS